METLVEMGYLPERFRNYRNPYLAVFDIECLERKTHEAYIQAYQKTVSIASATNIPGHKTEFFCRKSSSTEHGLEMFETFFSYLLQLADDLETHIPQEILVAQEKIQFDIACGTFSKKKTELSQF